MKRTTGALGTLLVATLSVALPTSESRGDTDSIEGERAAAIRALYGVGLSIEREGDRVSLDWGTLTEARWQRYVTEHYMPALKDWGFPLQTDTEVVFGETYYHKDKLAGHVLIEPLEKLTLCERLASGIRDDDLEKQMLDFCRESALEHVASSIVAFRGEPVSYSSPVRVAGATLGEELFAGAAGKRRVLITVAGPGALDSFRGYQATRWIANGIRYDAPSPLKNLATAAKRAAEKGLAAARVRIARRDKSLARARGNVVFTDGMVEGWDPIKPLGPRATPACRDAYAHVYGPRKQGAYELVLRANGVHCGSEISGQGFVKHASVHGTCNKVLESGRNTISVTVAKNINKVAGTRRDKRKLRKVKYYSNKAGKVMAKGTITCKN